MFPWPHSPKANRTPSHNSLSTMTCAPVLESVVTIFRLPSSPPPGHGLPEAANTQGRGLSHTLFSAGGSEGLEPATSGSAGQCA